jgi:fatty acid amide hydrolase
MSSDLTSLDATDMAGLLRAREVSSEELVRAHLARIDALDPAIHAFTEVLGAEALASAQRSDEERRRGEDRGPLFGLPVSVKENLDMVGHAPTLGVPARKGRIAQGDATLVSELRRAGAVILGRTNVPQLLLSHECENGLYGRTNNPWSLAHAPGGSSGGEAAAIASGMSPLGVGTDIGGSIRVPAHFSGICGLKPTLDRWSNVGSNGGSPGQEVIRSQAGPMARTARDVAMFFTALDPRRMAETDPLVAPMAVRDPRAIDPTKLRVGYFVDDGQVPTSASVRRAVRTAVAALERTGIEVRPFLPPAMSEGIEMFFQAMSSDGGTTALNLLEGGPMDPSLARMRKVSRMSNAARSALAAGLRLAGDARAARMVGWLGERTVTAYWDLTRRARVYRLRFLKALRDARIDVLLAPAHATPAMPHGLSRDFAAAGSCSMLFNLLQMPGGVVPVTTVRADEIVRPSARDRLEKRAASIDAQSLDLPIGVQVVGLPWSDEEVLAVMLVLDEATASDPLKPRTPRHLSGHPGDRPRARDASGTAGSHGA